MTEEEKKKLAEDTEILKKEQKTDADLLQILSILCRKSERDSPLRNCVNVDIEYNPNTLDAKAGIATFQGKLMDFLKALDCFI